MRVVEKSESRPGDQDNNILFYQYHYKTLYTYVMQRVGCQHLTEDVMQELYIKVLKIPDSTRLENPKSYLIKMAFSLISDHFRNNSNKHETGHDDVIVSMRTERDIPEDIAIRENLLEALQQKLAKLPKDKRDVLWLSRVDGWNYSKIAKHKKRSLSWVEKAMADALALIGVFGQQGDK